MNQRLHRYEFAAPESQKVVRIGRAIGTDQVGESGQLVILADTLASAAADFLESRPDWDNVLVRRYRPITPAVARQREAHGPGWSAWARTQDIFGVRRVS